MIRNLKVLLAAAMALAALGAISASGAHAAEEKFHCSVEPCTLTFKQDGTTTTAHHVIVLKGESNGGVKGSTVSLTCSQLTGEATATAKTLTEGKAIGLVYDGCKIAGEVVTVSMASCFYRFTSAGGGTAGGSVFHLECTNAGDGITLVVGGVTCAKVTPMTATGVKYHDAFPPKKEEDTVELSNIAFPIAGVHLENVTSPVCKNLLNLKTVESATYATGSTIVTAETHPGGVMTKVWFE